MAAGPLLLLVEDDLALRRVLRLGLLDEGFRVVEAATGAECLQQLGHGPDAVLLDLGLPDVDGVDLCRRMRSTTGVPLVVISGRGAQDDVDRSLDAGADDFLAKPFLAVDLARRTRALLQPPRWATAAAVVAIGDLEVDLDRVSVATGGRRVPLTRTEVRLLCELAEQPRRTVSRSALLRGLWDIGPAGLDAVLEVRIASLRARLDDAGSLVTIVVSAGGYCLRH